MIDNFSQIKSLLKFDSEDDFYHLQIIKRKKDNPDAQGRNNNARCMKTYYVTSPEYLDIKREEMIALCNIHNARACINLNRRSFEKIAYQTLIKITGQIMSKDFKSARRAYDSVCGANSNEKSSKKWIIDIDTKDESFLFGLERDLYFLQPAGHKIITMIPTKSGYHIITSPFNKSKFKEICQNLGMEVPDLQCDNPTILFIP